MLIYIYFISTKKHYTLARENDTWVGIVQATTNKHNFVEEGKFAFTASQILNLYSMSQNLEIFSKTTNNALYMDTNIRHLS
jgi:hypothetical protein